jgi:hypothetical protein
MVVEAVHELVAEEINWYFKGHCHGHAQAAEEVWDAEVFGEEEKHEGFDQLVKVLKS